MIQKIEKLVSIGKFRNYQAAGDVTFKKLTVLYGDNGSGKTTLTSIIRSLAVNDPELIKRRKSVNETTNQAAQIISNNGAGNVFHTFHHTNGWTAPYANIEIFDIHFVNDNVYSGFEFTDDHKRKLHQFVVGAQGVAIQRQIEQNKQQKATLRQNISSIENELIHHVNGLTAPKLGAFVSMQATRAADIDIKIGVAETALSSANANATIRTLQKLNPLSRLVTNINIPGIIRDLVATSETIQNDALKELFTLHSKGLSEGGIGRPETWLQTGFVYITNKRQHQTDPIQCPFCAQPVDDTMDLLKAYTLKFDAAFNELVNNLQEYNTSLISCNLAQKLQQIKNEVRINAERIVSWTPHLPANVTVPVLAIEALETTINAEFIQLKHNVQSKIQNPSTLVAAEGTSAFQDSVRRINQIIDAYNSETLTYNSGITNFLSQIQTTAQAQQQVDELRLIKRRFEQQIIDLCGRLGTEKSSLRVLDDEYPILVAQQESAASAFFVLYRDKVNYYLQTVFKTLFKIDNVTHVRPQGQSTQSKLAYELTIDGQSISLDETHPRNAKDSLSEGDKSTIALAFFLSKLEIDSGLNNKIVVFDDPLSSLDSNRRMNTVQLMRDLFPRIKQLIVSSHNEHFLFEIYRSIAPADKKPLRINENFLAKASNIEPLDLEVLVKNEYFKHVDEITAFLQTPNIARREEILGKLRNVLEAHLRFKFYHQLRVLPPNGQTFGALITELSNQGVPFRNNSVRVAIIAKLNLINGISCRPHHGEPIPDYGVLGVNPATISVAELAGFVTDTIDLINNDL